MKNILFAIPGREFSGNFLSCWTDTLLKCIKNGINPMLSNKYSSMVSYARCLCLGADVRRGVNQAPYDGKINYDYIMWIDSDIVFSFEQIQKLISYDKDIVSGIYKTENGENFACVKDWDQNYYKKNGSFYFLQRKDVLNRHGLMEVDYNGMGFMLIKKGVFEKVKYPWFCQLKKQIGDLEDYCSEDVAFCHLAQEAGFKIYIDPEIVVGHEKMRILT